MCALTISKTITQKNKHFQILITPRAAKLRIGVQTCYIFCTKVVTSQTLTQFSSGINFEGGPEGGFTSCSVTRCCFTRLARGRARSCRGTSRARAGLDVPILPKVLGGLGLHNGGPPRAGGGGQARRGGWVRKMLQKTCCAGLKLTGLGLQNGSGQASASDAALVQAKIAGARRLRGESS